LEEWKIGMMTDAAIAVALQHLIAEAHSRTLPQYSVFRLFPTNSTVVSFNWDGLASARCPQRGAHPHGRLTPHRIVPGALDDALNQAQMIDGSDARNWLIPGLVLPGEEDAPRLRTVREEVFALWRSAASIAVVGYSFGLTSGLRYDQIWLDTFVEALSINRAAPVNIISPDAPHLRGELAERLKRTVNVHAWPVRWNVVGNALENVARPAQVTAIAQLRLDRSAMKSLGDAVCGEPTSAFDRTSGRASA
jgi:hypothetical protein